jgi:hypothetical protein
MDVVSPYFKIIRHYENAQKSQDAGTEGKMQASIVVLIYWGKTYFI